MTDRPFKVLVVDDEPHNGDAVRRAFKKNDEVSVELSLSGQEGLEVLRKRQFDLFLVDFSMAGLNGVEFVEQARRDAPDSVFVMLTGYPELRQVVEAHARGVVDGILGKPWSIEELNLALRQARAMRHMRAIRKGPSLARPAPKTNNG